jgi:gluconate 2-dehydrogenase gamma chain
MAGQGIERREIFRYIAIASVAATFPGFRQWTFACAHDEHVRVRTQGSSETYKPLFLSPEQFRTVEHLTEMMIPADDSPGAQAAGVAEFIDFMLANRVAVAAREDARSVEERLRQGTAAQVRFAGGLSWLDARSRSEHKRKFMDCTREQQVALLEELAYRSKFTATSEGGREFFQMLRDYTVVGFYTSKIGLESLGYPGLRTFWPKMQACPHPDDPEHVHLMEPGGAAPSTRLSAAGGAVGGGEA